MRGRARLEWVPSETTLRIAEYVHPTLFRQLTGVFGRIRAGQIIVGIALSTNP